MEQPFSRTELLLGAEGVKRLRDASVAVFGIGGVGGYVVEALARSGVGRLHLIDHDTVSVSNLNRQIIATVSTIGRYKVDVARERVLDINPEAKVSVYRTFFVPDKAEEFDFAGYDYVVDAIDTVTGKLALIMEAKRAGTPVISSMGAGNKLDASAFEVADIYQTLVCPLAKVMRRELKKRGVRKLKVVYSREQPVSSSRPPGSNAFVPAAAGLILAGEVVKDLSGAAGRTV
ncbi:MAG: tRNA threonylcarbamoyladenosine dehydratase [Dorea sp.]|nr:tRNA threonylcarbamoyladenosine dehydratase [Dorea sp.]